VRLETVTEYLARGGHITRVPSGMSSRNLKEEYSDRLVWLWGPGYRERREQARLQGRWNTERTPKP